MGRVVFRVQVAWIPRLPFFSVVPASIIVGFFVPLTFLSLFFLPFKLLGGLWVSRLHCMYFRRFGRGSSQSSSLASRGVLYGYMLQFLCQLINELCLCGTDNTIGMWSSSLSSFIQY
jgi:hypothetical protein